MTIKQYIRKLRAESKLSQEEFAERLGVDRSSVARWEAGTNKPSTKHFAKICELFNGNLNDCLEIAGYKNSK